MMNNFDKDYHDIMIYRLIAQTHLRRVLDLNCKEGYGVELLAEYAKDVIAINKNAKQRKLAKNTCISDNIKFTGRLPLANNQFDKVMAIDLLDTFNKPNEFFDTILGYVSDIGEVVITTKKYSQVDFNNICKKYFKHVLLFKHFGKNGVMPVNRQGITNEFVAVCRNETISNKISLCMVVHNEEKNLTRLLPEIKNYVDEIVIIDQNSDDRTWLIVNKYNAKYIKVEYKGHSSPDRLLSIKRATYDWIFIVDPDEMPDKNLLEDLHELTSSNKYDAYFINVRQFCNGKHFEIFGKNPTARLFKKHDIIYTNKGVIPHSRPVGFKRPTNTDYYLNHYRSYEKIVESYSRYIKILREKLKTLDRRELDLMYHTNEWLINSKYYVRKIKEYKMKGLV